MDVYHKVLVKLYEVTGGRDSEKVDLKELVRKEGFLPSYSDIFQHLSRQSWIAETPRPDIVRITHWGAKEAKKSQSAGGESNQAVKKEINRLISDVRELIVFLEELAGEPSKETALKAEKKLNLIVSSLQNLKESLE
jgi:hypothetical protein